MERAVLTGLIVGYAIHNMFVFDNLASYIMFFITLGFLHLSSVEAAGDAAKPGKLAKISDKIAAVAVNPEVTEWIVAPVLVILVVGVAYFFNYRPISANLDLIQGIDVLSVAGRTECADADRRSFCERTQCQCICPPIRRSASSSTAVRRRSSVRRVSATTSSLHSIRRHPPRLTPRRRATAVRSSRIYFRRVVL